VVYVSVILLGVRYVDVLRTVRRVDGSAAVVDEDVALRILGIDPDVMAVAAARLPLRERERLRAAAVPAERLAAVLRTVHRARHDEDVVGVLRVDDHADVVARAPYERAVPAHD